MYLLVVASAKAYKAFSNSRSLLDRISTNCCWDRSSLLPGSSFPPLAPMNLASASERIEQDVLWVCTAERVDTGQRETTYQMMLHLVAQPRIDASSLCLWGMEEKMESKHTKEVEGGLMRDEDLGLEWQWKEPHLPGVFVIVTSFLVMILLPIWRKLGACPSIIILLINITSEKQNCLLNPIFLSLWCCCCICLSLPVWCKWNNTRCPIPIDRCWWSFCSSILMSCNSPRQEASCYS